MVETLMTKDALARGAGVALWRQIALALEADIAGGKRQPGERLPTEAVLTERFAVNRHTVRRALEELEARGIIRVEQGRGAFVAEDVLDYPLGPRTRFSETIRRQNREAQGVFCRFLKLPRMPRWRRVCAFGAGARCCVLRGLGLPMAGRWSLGCTISLCRVLRRLQIRWRASLRSALVWPNAGLPITGAIQRASRRACHRRKKPSI
ncbi:MAG: hypothetical protein RL312_526, partial [Pseudomonadota bacterium]